jgi:kinesin family protein C1
VDAQHLNKTTNITFVELAGCEKYPPLQGQGGALPADASRAQKGLLAVSDVLCALSSRAAFVPYRNSKLTFLLQPSLTPDSASIVLTNVRSEDYRCTETANALTYAAQIQQAVDANAPQVARKQPQQAVHESTDMDAWIGQRAIPLGMGNRRSRSRPWK